MFARIQVYLSRIDRTLAKGERHRIAAETESEWEDRFVLLLRLSGTRNRSGEGRWLMSKPDLRGLYRFVRKRDRVPAACFVGRQDFIEQIEDDLDVVMEEAGAPDGDASGLTQLIQGAPGAGKTALLKELVRRWRTAERERLTSVPNEPATGIPVPVMLDRDLLYDEGETVLAITAAMAKARGGAGEQWRTNPERFRLTETTGLKGAISAPGLSVGGQRGSAVAPQEATFDVLRELQPPSTWVRPVCLMVDEIQGVAMDAKEVLNKLHNRMEGLPVLTVLAGLGDSYDHLNNEKKVGLSRFGSEVIHDIGCLAPEEAGESVHGMLALFRVVRTPADVRWWAERIAEDSDGWPQHFHNGQRALAEGLLATGGRLGDVDAASVIERARKLREGSYERRISPEMEEAFNLTIAVMTDVSRGATRAAALNSIDLHSEPAATGSQPPREWRLPEGMTARAFLTHLVHRGALQRGPDNLYACPIPSFRSYLIEGGWEEPPPPVLAAPPEDDDLPEPP